MQQTHEESVHKLNNDVAQWQKLFEDANKQSKTLTDAINENWKMDDQSKMSAILRLQTEVDVNKLTELKYSELQDICGRYGLRKNGKVSKLV